MPAGFDRVPLWVWWIPVILIASFPLGPTPDPQWHRVHAIPFTDPDDKLSDLAINVLLFAPFGYSLVQSRRHLGVVIAAAAGTSIGAELMQLFSTVRNPSGTDVVYAVAGAAAGAIAAVLARRGETVAPSALHDPSTKLRVALSAPKGDEHEGHGGHEEHV